MTDHLGSTRYVASSTDVDMEFRRDYYPFGEDYSSVGSVTDYKFTGKEHDESELYYYGARYYSPKIGRFLAPDPAGQYFSPYLYCGNNPVNLIDPTGTTAYVDSSGNVLHDDGEDNALEVTTTQDVVDEHTDDEGVTDWDAVRNADGSSCTITDNEKYWGWADDVQNSIIDSYDGAAAVSVDNMGNVTVRTSPGVLENMVYILGPVAAARVIGGVGNRLFFGNGVSNATLRAFERQLRQHGQKSLQRSLRSLEKRLVEHIRKLNNSGGHTSSIKREIRTIKSQIKAIKKTLGR